MKIITLLTDFGLHDPYVGIMKGAILGINPGAAIVDITHDVEPQDIGEAAFLIEEYQGHFPAGTIHVAVVDPGVGSTRRPIAVDSRGCIFVGPDNGIFTLVMESAASVRTIKNPDFMRSEISSTFHGRDVFAPAAALLARGAELSSAGPLITDAVRIEGLMPTADGDVLAGKIIRLDRFGNAITNIKAALFHDFLKGNAFDIRVGDMTFTTLSKSYFEAEFTCLEGSSGYLEFGNFKGNFAAKRGVKKGDEVLVIRQVPIPKAFGH